MAKPAITTRATKGSALTWTEGDNNFTNLKDATITLKAGTGGTDVVSDLNGTVTLVAGTNVTLSGDNTAKTVTINSTASGGASTLNDLTDVTISGSPSTGQVLKWSTATSQWTNQSDAGIDGVYADPNPSLGGNLTVMGYSIVSAAAGDIAITPNSTGNIVLDGQKWPQADGTANQILKTDGAGQLSWTTGGGGISNVVEDTTPQLGGNLDVNGNSIVSTSNGDIVIEPNGTGDVHIITDALRIGDLNAEARISTYGTGNLVLTTNEGNDPDPSITISNGANANITLTPSGTGKVIISGDLQIDGTTTTVNSTTIDVDDINITLAKGAANAAAANGGGITLEGPTTAATITYTSADDRWNMNKTLAATLVGNVTGTASVASTVSLGTASSGAHYLSMFEADTGNLQTRVNTSVYYNPTSKLLAVADNAAGQIWTDTLTSSKTGGASLDNFIIGASTARNGTFAQLKMNSLVETGGTASTATGTYTFTPNAANGTVQTLNMSTATSLTFSAFTSPVAGQSITVIVTNGTGGVTTFTSTMKFPTSITKTLTAGNGSIDIITVYYNGTTYFANIAKGFA